MPCWAPWSSRDAAADRPRPIQPAAAAGYRFVQVASGFESPVHVTAPRNQRGRVYVVEQEGRIRIVQNGRVTGTLLDIRSQVQCCGEQGLLSVAFHPRYTRNGKYYVNYTDRGGDSRVVEYRGRRRLQQLMFWDDPYSNHNGGQNAFGPDGRLYVAWATQERAAIPRTGRRTSARPSASCSRSTSTGGERGGRSWATACATGGSRSTERPAISTSATSARTAGRRSTSRPGGAPASRTTAGTSTRAARFENKPLSGPGKLVRPVVVYPLSGGHYAVSGGFVYRGNAVPAAKGRYFYGDNCSGTVWSFPRGRARSVRQEPFSLGGLSSFGEDAAGELYAVTLNGRLYQLRSG